MEFVQKLKSCFFKILVVSKVTELYRKLREACRKNFPQVSSKSEPVEGYNPLIGFICCFENVKSIFDVSLQDFNILDPLI